MERVEGDAAVAAHRVGERQRLLAAVEEVGLEPVQRLQGDPYADGLRVLLAALDDCAADPAVPGVQLAGARLVGVERVAAVVVVVDGALENVGGALEGRELGAPVLELDAKFLKSCRASTVPPRESSVSRK